MGRTPGLTLGDLALPGALNPTHPLTSPDSYSCSQGLPAEPQTLLPKHPLAISTGM